MSSPRPPHLVLFNPDQWRGDVLGHMGNPAAVTPNLDALTAREAVSFRNAFCQNPVCTPSRCSFMTGWYPHVRGHRTMHHMLRADEPVLLRTLKENGYFVWWGGKNDLVPGQHGYSQCCDVKHRADKPIQRNLHVQRDWRGAPDGDNFYSFYRGRMEQPPEGSYLDFDWAMVAGALEFLRDPPRDRRLCIYLPIGYPHPPYAVEEPFFSMIDRRKLPPRLPTPPGPFGGAPWEGKPSLLKGIAEGQRLQGWTEDRWTELRATYYGMCARVDHQVGLLVEALKRADLYDDAALFVFADHGDFTGDYGLVEKTQNTFEDCLTRVPFVFKPPRAVPLKPGVREALVELLDLPATVEALTGIAPRHDHFGKSLLPLLTDEKAEHRDAVFCEGGRRRGERQAMELESLSADNPAGLYWPRLRLQTTDEGVFHTKAAMCRTREFKYVKRLYEADELYDLRGDPGELHNLARDPACADALRDLKDRLLTWYQETCDVVPHETDKRN